MRSSLTLKLILAFLVVSLTGAAIAAGLARWTSIRNFNQLVRDQAESSFTSSAASYYLETGTWLGVREHLRAGPRPVRRTQGRPRPNQFLFVYLLADSDGLVVMPSRGFRMGERLPDAVLAQGSPVEVDGEVVGWVIATGEPPPFDPREQLYLKRTNRALILSGFGAALVALILGVVMARSLTRPLRELTAAIQAMARGNLDQRVDVRSRDELGELGTAFNRMSADLERANRMRRQMTADIAHDLRTPLTVISGYLESLRDGVLDPVPERFDMMYDEARHLQRLVDDLGTLSLADAGELKLNRQMCSPNELLTRVANTYRDKCEEKGVSLDVRVEDGIPEVRIDMDRMIQVLGNLVGNSLRYTSSGGRISLNARAKKGSVVLVVEDTGAGIPQQDLPNIFDRFYRSDKARQGLNGETGLGLSIARSMVEAHGGAVSVESEVGVGTRFQITLP